MYRQIAVPLDGSQFAESALPLAIRLAQRTGADLRLLKVVESSPEAADEGEVYLTKVVDRISEDVPGEVRIAVRTGPVTDALLQGVEDCETDVTVMATHGRGGLSRAWLGSIATGFLHETDKPLILVRPEDPEAATPVVHWGFAKLLVPLDGTELSERALTYATEFGHLFDAAYHLTRIVGEPLGAPQAALGSDVTAAFLDSSRKAALEYLEGYAELLRDRGLTVTTSVSIDTQAARGILETVDAEGCDSIAMATHGRVGVSRALLGSAADKVLRAATVPLLLYRPDPAPAP